MIDVESAIKARFDLLSPLLNERTRRLISAAEAGVLGRGGITIVSRVTGVSRRAIAAGLAELRSRDSSARGRIRRPGGGRRRRIVDDATLEHDLEGLINPVSKGDLTSPLRWTCSSVRTLAAELVRMGHATSHRMVAELLHSSGYSLQSKRKRVEGQGQGSRDIQFELINLKVSDALQAGDPVLMVETMTREFADGTKSRTKPTTATSADVEHHPTPNDHSATVPSDLCDPVTFCEHAGAHGKSRSGVLVDRDMAEFAIEVVVHWWHSMGQALFPQARKMLVIADIDGGDELTTRIWRSGLQKFADETEVTISVHHFPPATTRWRHVEHRLVATISPRLRDKPGFSHDVIVNLIATTPTASHLEEKHETVAESLPRSSELSIQEIENLLLTSEGMRRGWNYTIPPSQKSA